MTFLFDDMSGGYRTESVSFDRDGTTLRGNLYIPNTLRGPAAAVPVLGPYCFVKEQSPVQYATRLATEGFIALAFDASHHGESEGQPRRLEDPMTKVADVKAALDFLSNRPDVDSDRLAALGICEGSAEMLRVAADDSRVTALATVSGHYRDEENDVSLAGGEAFAAGEVERGEVQERLESRKERGAEALKLYQHSREVRYDVIVHPYRKDVPLPWRMIWDWYHGWADRGLWENRYAVMSDVPYFAFESLTAAEQLRTPLLMVHADNSDGPDSARQHFAAVPGTDKRLIWQGETNHFQYYEDPTVIDQTVSLAAAWFRDHQ